jgi:hypothetical protein
MDRPLRSAQRRLQDAVEKHQAMLQADLQEEQLKVFSVLGRGGFGTVYHGALPYMGFVGVVTGKTPTVCRHLVICRYDNSVCHEFWGLHFLAHAWP